MKCLKIVMLGLLLWEAQAFAVPSTSTQKALIGMDGFYSSQYVLAANRYRQTTSYRLAPRVFVFDPRKHRWFAYENGHLIASGRASGGAGYCPDIKRSCRTPVGTFRIIRKGPANCRSSLYPKPHGGARMDYCMFFSKYYAIHGSHSVPAANVSHGCIRVTPSDARWLSGSFMRIGTLVIVKPY